MKLSISTFAKRIRFLILRNIPPLNWTREIPTSVLLAAPLTLIFIEGRVFSKFSLLGSILALTVALTATALSVAKIRTSVIGALFLRHTTGFCIALLYPTLEIVLFVSFSFFLREAVLREQQRKFAGQENLRSNLMIDLDVKKHPSGKNTYVNTAFFSNTTFLATFLVVCCALVIDLFLLVRPWTLRMISWIPFFLFAVFSSPIIQEPNFNTRESL